MMIQNSEFLAYVRYQLGHRSIQITVDTYGRLVPGGNRQIFDKLDDNYATKRNTDATKIKKGLSQTG